jgi:hypothetical protein
MFSNGLMDKKKRTFGWVREEKMKANETKSILEKKRFK